MKVVVTLLLLTTLGACVTGPNPYAKPEPRVVDSNPPVEPSVTDRVIVSGKVLPLPEEERSISAYSLPEQRTVSPVVRNLIKKSQEQSGQNNLDGAANSLERALRIEPRNAMLWKRLADIRYLQKSWKKSIQLAAKSNTLAGGDNELRRENWYLMSNSYKALGNTSAEQKFREKLARQSR